MFFFFFILQPLAVGLPLSISVRVVVWGNDGPCICKHHAQLKISSWSCKNVKWWAKIKPRLFHFAKCSSQGRTLTAKSPTCMMGNFEINFLLDVLSFAWGTSPGSRALACTCPPPMVKHKSNPESNICKSKDNDGYIDCKAMTPPCAEATCTY